MRVTWQPAHCNSLRTIYSSDTYNNVSMWWWTCVRLRLMPICVWPMKGQSYNLVVRIMSYNRSSSSRSNIIVKSIMIMIIMMILLWKYHIFTAPPLQTRMSTLVVLVVHCTLPRNRCTTTRSSTHCGNHYYSHWMCHMMKICVSYSYTNWCGIWNELPRHFSHHRKLIKLTRVNRRRKRQSR